VLDGSEPVVVGRDPHARIHIDDRRVARHHAVLRRETGGWVLVDTGSRAGTFVGGRRVDRLELSDGVDVEVRLGDPAGGPILDLLQPAVEEARSAVEVAGSATVLRPRPDLEDSKTAPAPERDRPERERATATTGLGRLTTVHKRARFLRIGRAPGNDIVVNDLLASRYHAELHAHRDGGYEVFDVGSHNGTFVNGQRVRRARLTQLDVVGVGQHLFRVVGDALEEYVDTGEVAIEAVGLGLDVDGRTVVDGISLSLRERSFVAVVGPSGSGKTMLLHALSGLRPAQRGVVLYGGRDLYANYDELRQRIGFVPQDDVLHDELTVGRALEYASELRFPHDVPREERLLRVEEVIQELGLTGYGDTRISRLSGGQRKRVSVGIELLTKPSLLFLDEPTSGLDPGYQRELMELLRALADGDRTVIVVTHSVQNIRLCNRVLVVAPGGRLAYFGPAQLAPAYFGHGDFQQVFQDLTSSPEADWPGRFRAHPEYHQYVGLSAQGRATAAPPRAERHPPARRGPWLAQFFTLTRRYAELLLSDRRNFALLLLQAPLLGLIMLLALPPGQLEPPPDGEVRLAAKGGLVLLILVMGATWLGASNAVREIVKELPIFRRERAVGLSTSAYVASKAVVLAALTTFQAAVLVALATARQGGPIDALAVGWPVGELAVALALTGIAGMALGLLVSALTSRTDRAMTVLPIVLIVELILAMGAVFPEVTRQPGLEQLSHVAGTQWGFAATASTAGLNDLEPLNRLAESVPTLNLADPRTSGDVAPALRGEPRWDHEAWTWAIDVAALAGLTIVALVGASLALLRYDPRA
jgi:ABC-type multidrug transport system ATPase subunit/pSer/pThr/pTyr-binding forkhead associated (FHA) protein